MCTCMDFSPQVENYMYVFIYKVGKPNLKGVNLDINDSQQSTWLLFISGRQLDERFMCLYNYDTKILPVTIKLKQRNVNLHGLHCMLHKLGKHFYLKYLNFEIP